MITGVIIIDHGSRSAASNDLLADLVRRFGVRFWEKFSIVEPAHMELAEPSLAKAFARCVNRGANHVIVAPYFLGPGKHLQVDIPQLTAEAAAPYPDVTWQIAPPLGIDDLMLRLLDKRIHELPPVKSEKQYDSAQ